MGVMADSFMEYAQPLFDQTDGSLEQMNKAASLAQLCFNLALLPQEQIEEGIAEVRPILGMDEAEFEDFRTSLILPMIRRHHHIFPGFSKQRAANGQKETWTPKETRTANPRAEKYPGTGRNDPCPCNSGKKYKKCCGP